MISPNFTSNIYQILFLSKEPHNLRSEKGTGPNTGQNCAHPGYNFEAETLDDYLFEKRRTRDVAADRFNQGRHIRFLFAFQLYVDRSRFLSEKLQNRLERRDSLLGKFGSCVFGMCCIEPRASVNL